VNKRRWSAGIAVSGIAVAGIAVAVLSDREAGRAADHRSFHVMNRDRGPLGDAFFRGITELGSIWASVGAAAALSRMGRRRQALDALGAAAAVWTLGQVLKRAIRRPRPYHALASYRLLIDEPRGTSFPSSHPAVLLAFVTVAGRDLEAPRGVRAGLGALAGVVGCSRVYLGVHFPSDVVGGLLLGRAAADLWSSSVSPLIGNRPAAVPGTVTR